MADDRDTVKKQTRMVENDRQKYHAAVKQQLQKQGDTISALKKENDKMKSDLASKSGGSYSFAEQDKSAALQQEIDALERKVNFEKLRARDLDKKLAVSRMDLARTRKSMGGVNITAENTMLIEKQVRVLENRLDQALVQFNEALAYNRQLRQQIDNLRGERKVFTEIYGRLESELHEKKKKMADIIERSNRDYEESDALDQQLKTLRAAAAEDSKKYDEHFARLDEMMLKYKQLKEQQQQQQLQQQQQIQAQKSANKGASRGAEETRRDDRTTTKSAPKPSEAKADDAAAVGEEEEGDLQEVIDQLKEATGIQELDLLHHKFVKSEEQNFSTYNFVNELNTEAEHLEAEIAVLQEEYAKIHGDTERSAALKALENELAVTETQHEALVSRTTKAKEALEGVRSTSQEIFTKINCSTKMAEDLLGTTECNELNLLTFLGIIEHRANELLFASNLAAAQEMKKRAAGKDEEARRRREQREADRQARREAGESVADDEDLDDDGDDDVAASTNDSVRARFVGVGPQSAKGQLTAKALVSKEALPTTNTTDAGAGDGDDVEEDTILDHNALRAKMEERLNAQRDKAKRNRGRRQQR